MASLDSTNASSDLQRGPVLLAISVCTTALALASCVVRFCVRTKSQTRIGWDDYSIVVAMMLGFVGTILSIVESLSTSTPIKSLQFSILSQPWIMMGAAMAKISICFFFIRLVGKQKPWNILIAFQIVILSIVNTLFTLTTNLQCQPLEKLWNPAVVGACWDPMIQQNIGYAQGAFTVFTDFFLTLFPILIVRDMNVRKSMRWPFYAVASLSFFAGFCAIIRTYEMSVTSRQTTYTNDRFTASVLSIFEQNLGILGANILCLGPLIDRTRKNAEDIEMRAKSAEETQDDSFFIIEGPRRSSVDTIDREKFLVSTKVAGMWGIGSAASKQTDDNDDDDLKTASNNNKSSSRKKQTSSSGRKGNKREDMVEEYWNEEAPQPWGIIKTVSVEVVNEAISDLEKKTQMRKDDDEHRKAAKAPVRAHTGDAIADGLKNIGGNLRSLAGSMSGRKEDESKKNKSQGAMGGSEEGEQDWETMLRGGPA